jgi:hypothetical protein
MSLLAKLWHQQGRSKEASQLLIDCLQGLFKEVKEAKYNSDRKRFEEEYQRHRETFLELLPDQDGTLTNLGLPSSTPKTI